MDRLTKQLPDGTYIVVDGYITDDIIKKLAKLENMYDALYAEQSKIILDMEKLRAVDKTKTVTYKQLLANKLMNMNLIGRFDIYGL